MRYEFWFDSHHTGAIRIIDHQRRVIHGSDPREKRWTVPFTYGKNRNHLVVDFSTKKTHRHCQHMEPVYRARRQVLHWPDGNEWRRIRVDPRLVLKMI